VSTITKPIQCPECDEIFDVDFDATETELQTECECGEEIPFEYDPTQSMLIVMDFEEPEAGDEPEIEDDEDDEEDEEDD
jgi:hypothetical protein